MSIFTTVELLILLEHEREKNLDMYAAYFAVAVSGAGAQQD